MTGEEPRTPDVRAQRLRFPWPSALAGLLVAGYLLLLGDPALTAFYDLPPEALTEEVRYGVFGIFLLVVLFDLRRHHRLRARQDADLARLRRQFDELWERHRQLRQRASTYADHADKLKLFISDKLLEYIEYDEKFLHFRGIAAEIRHNGAISFDKVQTALQHAAAEASGDGGDAARPPPDYRGALEAMRYLWDLLDLSTADNLALHIGNHLAECEEHYCQRLLSPDDAAPLPYEPTFSPQHAAWRALSSAHPEPLPAPANGEAYAFADDRWRVHLAPAGELLGNENHMVLMLDNLLRNAQFFSRKHSRRAAFPPISLELREEAGYAVLEVYNRGPRIPPERIPYLFQLGYSTRRRREQHGHGLGLYFVNEIVKGYEGHITVNNIEPPEARYDLHLELENGERLHRRVAVREAGARIVCREVTDDSSEDASEGAPADAPAATDDDASGKRSWTLPAPLRSAEVTAADAGEGQRLDDFSRKGKQTRLDPGHPGRPHWRVVYSPRRRNPELTFEPLDIRGVAFQIRLPTAQQRIEGSAEALDDDLDVEMERLDEHFRPPAG